ncbi:putative hydrolase [Anopheles sinensis]|uniref:Putative hydrolase n=1 Tax=Anopheles sinensis TaxID=74873 RepID=A0A084W5B2_ANOSI|nr:putative hydrolase [Anopheles sinensis]
MERTNGPVSHQRYAPVTMAARQSHTHTHKRAAIRGRGAANLVALRRHFQSHSFIPTIPRRSAAEIWNESGLACSTLVEVSRIGSKVFARMTQFCATFARHGTGMAGRGRPFICGIKFH